MKKFLILFLFLAFIDLAIACSCAPATVEEHTEYATAVFRGKILDTYADPLSGDIAVRIEPTTLWKGIPQNVVYTTGDSASCGYQFREGEEYIIFAYDNEGRYTTGLCTATSPVNKELLAKLGDGQQIRDGTKELEVQSFFGQQSLATNMFWIFIFIAIVVIGVVGHVRKKKKMETAKK